MCNDDIFMRNFSKRLRKVADVAGSVAALEEKVGVAKDRLTRAIRNKTSVKVPFIHKICEVTGVRPCWLVSGQEPMYPGTGGTQTIPTYRTGGGLHWQVSDQCQSYNTTVPANLIAFEVDGDSMEPVARHGQVVMALRDVAAGNGDLAVVELNDDMHTFKRILYTGTAIILASVNPAHKPEIISARDIRRTMKVWGVKF